MILKYPENICMLCIPMVMHKNPSDKSIYGQRYNEDG
nr:tetracycline resistance determinant leader peptide [Staphylococcus aureus]